MARIAAPLVLCALLFASVPAQAQYETPHPDQFLESGSIVAGTEQDHPFSSTTQLVANQWYRVVISGTWTLEYPADGVRPSHIDEVDPVWCYHQTPQVYDDGQGTCGDSQTLDVRLGGQRFGGSGFTTGIGQFFPLTDSAYDIPAFPAVTANHSYDVTFQAKYSGPLTFWDAEQYGYPNWPTRGDGSYGFQLFGVKPATTTGGGPTTTGGGTTTSPITNDWGKGPGWVVGPATFRIPTNGYSLSGRKFTYYLQSTTDASVAESVTAYVGGKAYYAGKFGGALKAGKVYVLTVAVRKSTYKVMNRALHKGKAVTMRTWFTVESAAGNVRKYIDLTFKR